MDHSADRTTLSFARWQELKAILSRALECDSDSARLECLSASCGDDLVLRAKIEQLLAQDDRTWCDDAFLAGLKATLFRAVTPAIAPIATNTEPPQRGATAAS
jgi:hypothetical protein